MKFEDPEKKRKKGEAMKQGSEQKANKREDEISSSGFSSQHPHFFLFFFFQLPRISPLSLLPPTLPSSPFSSQNTTFFISSFSTNTPPPISQATGPYHPKGGEGGKMGMGMMRGKKGILWRVTGFGGGVRVEDRRVLISWGGRKKDKVEETKKNGRNGKKTGMKKARDSIQTPSLFPPPTRARTSPIAHPPFSPSPFRMEKHPPLPPQHLPQRFFRGRSY